MSDGVAKGNNPVLWEKFLADLDEKLQLGLLDRMRRVQAYHFESDTLFVEPGSKEDEAYLKKSAQFTQLCLLAQDSTGVTEVKFRPAAPSEE
ncbi:MAG: hypothetical protein RL518_358 [Pseudomonadota bacterium]|jgi:hypothetical protein